MENILGQLQFRLENSQVTYYCGEQYYRNTAAIKTIVDGNQTEFVFVQGEDGELYYTNPSHDRLWERRLTKLNVSGTSFSIVRDDRGFLIVLVVSGCDVFAVRQKMFYSNSFEAPFLLYRGDAAVHELRGIYWKSRLYLALKVTSNNNHRVMMGIDEEDMVWDDLGEVSNDTRLQWIGHEDVLSLELSNSKSTKRYFPAIMSTLDCVGLHQSVLSVKQLISCLITGGFFECFGLVLFPDKKREVFCGYRNHEWQMICQLHDVVKYHHCFYGNRHHLVLLDLAGVVYHITIDLQGNIIKKVLTELGIVKSIDLFLTSRGIRLYGVDAYNGLIHGMMMICPDRGWVIHPMVLYYQKQYQIRILQCPAILDRLKPSLEHHILPGLQDKLRILFQQDCIA